MTAQALIQVLMRQENVSGRQMDSLPLTQAALVEHIKRAAYQAGHVWSQMFEAVPSLPSIS